MQNIGVIVDNDFYNDARVPNEVKILSEYYNVYVLCFKHDKKGTVNTAHVIPDNVYITQIYMNRKLKDILFGIQNTIPIYDYFWAYHIKKLIKKYSLVSIHVNDFYMTYMGWLAKKTTKVSLIVDLHENYPAAVLNYTWTKHFLKKHLAKPKKWAKIEGKWLSYVDKIIVVHENLKNVLLGRYSFLKPEQIAVYSNVPDVKRFKSYEIDKSVFDKKDKFVVFYFGVVNQRRGVLTAIESINILKAKHSNIHLLIIGNIDKAEKSIIEPLLKNDNITYIPWINVNLLPSYLSITDVCIDPRIENEQHDTSFANKLYQYALYEKPQIVSSCKSHKAFIEENNCGVIFRSEDSKDLAEKIEYLMDNPDKCKEFGKNGKKAVEDKYNTEVFKKNLLDLYNTL
jgi:glycosyltransferase involved in cell wall biosynthesis